MEEIGINLDLGFGFTHMQGKVDEEFTKSSTSTYQCVGGDLQNLKDGNYSCVMPLLASFTGVPLTSFSFCFPSASEWVDSMIRNPSLIPGSYQLRPISSLVFDPVKRALLTSSIEAYLAK